MFDLFDFTPVDYDPFKRTSTPAPGPTQSVGPGAPPARPYTPTPPTQNDIWNMLYGKNDPKLPTYIRPGNDLSGYLGPNLPSPAAPLELPQWVPPDVQSYMNRTPSYAEGDMFPSGTVGEPPWPEPQVGDIRRLFDKRIESNALAGRQQGFSAQQLRGLMQLPGFSGFAGGDEI